MVKNINSFKTVDEAIAYYTKVVADASKNRDYSQNEEILNFKVKLHDRINKERTPIRLKWISPNEKYEVFGIIFPSDIIPSISVKIKGKKHRYTYNYTNRKRFPKYVIEKCEEIKRQLKKGTNSI
ncbi:hypothetical protein [Schinkia azotoformans]|uniref:hypothetical protein n=1 Tax=Schinkia azotoformans TaxID=1454 RepID=UPI002DB662A0|nr:hypothetical protein [Schinkia azotoformans]MEC1697782.1 hypothetical protein [Schinkia azotoformans]